MTAGKDGTEWSFEPLPFDKTPRKNIARIAKNRVPFIENLTSAVDFFHLFISRVMVVMVIKYTNMEGKRVRGDSLSDTDLVEIHSLIGCLIYIEGMKQHMEDMKVMVDLLEGLQLMPACFATNRLCDLRTFMGFDEKTTRNNQRERDLLAQIRDFLGLF